MRIFVQATGSVARPARALCLLGALAVLTACGADGEPETPTRGETVPVAVPSN